MPEDRRVAALVAVATAAVMAAAGWFIVLRPSGPSVPHELHSTLSLSPDHAHAGDEVHVYVDDPVESGRTGTLLVQRWDGHTWTDGRLLTNGQWSAPLGATYAVGSTVTGETTSAWETTVPAGTPDGDYLVCEDQQCGVLTIG